MSELTLTSTELKTWLEDETSSTLKPVHTQAQKHRDEVSATLQNVTDASKLLLDISAREIEKRNMRVYNRARALNKLARLFMDRIKKVSAPEVVTYDSLNKFAQETQKVFSVTDIDIKNWFPRISPFFIMDRRKFLMTYEKSKLPLISLNDFLTKEYVKTKTLEETFQLIDELHALEKQLSEVAAQRAELKSERLPIEKEIAELEQKTAALKSQGPVEQLFAVEAEAEALNTELKHKLRHLQKPFIKVQALAFQGGGAGLTPDELSTLDQYLEKPFKALATEQAGYPVLKAILQKVVRLMDEDKLKLKADKARKAEQMITEILKRDVLAGIYKRCVDVAAREKQLLNSEKLDEVRCDIVAFQEQVRQLKNRKLGIESHEAIKEKEYNALADRVSHHKSAVEKNVYASIDRKVKIQ